MTVMVHVHAAQNIGLRMRYQLPINNSINAACLICATNNEVPILKSCPYLVMNMIDNGTVMKDIRTAITGWHT